MIKIADFEFQEGEEPLADGALRLVFRVDPKADPVLFLVELSRFVGRLVSDAADATVSAAQHEQQVARAQAALEPESAPEPARRARAPRAASKPTTVQAAAEPALQSPAASGVAEPPPAEVTTTVIPPRQPEGKPTAASVRAAHPTVPAESAAQLVTLGEQIAQQAESPKALNGSATPGTAAAQSAAPSPVTAPSVVESTPAVAALPLDAIPAELRAVKSFRQALVWLGANGYRTKETLLAACQQYAAVPCIANYLKPNPDPECAIEKRIERAVASGVLGPAA